MNSSSPKIIIVDSSKKTWKISKWGKVTNQNQTKIK
jgi:hypothetical protein